MIDPGSLASTIQSQISNTVDDHIREYVGQIIRELSLDAAWISKIEQQINETITHKFRQKLNLIDLNHMVAASMDQAVERYYARQPKIETGVVDQAQQAEMVVTDGLVQVKNSISTPHLQVDREAKIGGTLTVENLSVKGFIGTDNRSWQQLVTALSDKTLKKLDTEWQQSMIDRVRSEITATGIDFDRVTVAGQPLVENGRLGNTVTASSLRSVGTLERLAVSGEADFSDSLAVRARRVGINTQHPEMALTVWDEETALMFGKHKEQTAYIGTSRSQKLVIGINRAPAIEIDENSKITVKNLTVGRHRICHEAEIPNYSGTKGDIVFNSNPRGDGIWGWQCLGAFKWQPLRSA